MKVVLDADVIIDYLRRKGAQNTLYFRIAQKYEKSVMSLVTVAEVYSGKSAQVGEKQREMLEETILGTELVAPILNDAKVVGKLRSEYELSLGDAFVAALALKLKLPLATLDRKGFEKIKGLKFYFARNKPVYSSKHS